MRLFRTGTHASITKQLFIILGIRGIYRSRRPGSECMAFLGYLQSHFARRKSVRKFNWLKNVLKKVGSHIARNRKLDWKFKRAAALASRRWVPRGVEVLTKRHTVVVFEIICAQSQWHAIGHFRVPKTLTFKMRLCAQPFLWKWVLFAREWKMISITKAEHVPSFSNRGPGELGNGLFKMVAQSSCRFRP